MNLFVTSVSASPVWYNQWNHFINEMISFHDEGIKDRLQFNLLSVSFTSNSVGKV